ncbi:conserved hypothetical protein [Ricinus communis]|uniref:Uncharacterized protein n=1 Tax=Ricinus communis TaxID=3988 RepID=B9S6G2_RICCO|nr:conserved hypothetical protein [Ricinus communis]|eukprot:XP_002521581.1 F-box protein At5g49610 [Ricinus communis]
MDRAKKGGTYTANRNHRIYMDLKDIVREHALRYLPAKSLCRFTSVCRDWRLYISTPFLAHNQSNSFGDVSGLFCQSDSSLPSFISLDVMAYGVPDPSLKFLPELVDIRCSSNGLLCCQGHTGYKAYYICNPVTRQWKKLPRPDANHGSDPALVLVYEPSLLNFVAEYKLICAFQSDLDGLEFEIYSSVEGSWRTFGEICFGNRRIIPSTGVYVDGVIYWRSESLRIVAFDLASERSTLLYLPLRSGALGVANGKLCSASMHGSKVTVAELTNAYTNTMQMNSKTRAWETRDITLNYTVFDGRSDNGILVFIGEVLVIQLGRTLISCHMKTEHIKQLATEDEHHARMIPYVNSLVEV